MTSCHSTYGTFAQRSSWVANLHTSLVCLALVGLQLICGAYSICVTNYIFVKVGLQALLKLRTELYAYLQSLSLKLSRRAALVRFEFSRRLRFAVDPDDLQQRFHQHLRFHHHARRRLCRSWCESIGN